MSIERTDNGYFASCDFCSETEELEADTFNEAVVAVQGEGWKVFKENGEWFHKCRCCCEGEHNGNSN